jgi:hypothetical protein
MFGCGSCGVVLAPSSSCSDLQIVKQKRDILSWTGLAETEHEQTASLLHGECRWEELDCNCTEEAELLDDDLLDHYQGKMTLATPPIELVAYLPDDHEPGAAIQMMGPHGPVSFVPPEYIRPGEKVCYRLAPPPEFRIEVPCNASPGSMVEFERSDGVLISVTVPPGLGPGDTFDVTPPSVLVRVPDDPLPGDQVIFQIPNDSGYVGRGEAPLCRATVPFRAMAGSYFAVRLPVPDNLPGTDLDLSNEQDWPQDLVEL